MYNTSFRVLTYPCIIPPLTTHLFFSFRSNTFYPSRTFLCSSLNDDSFSTHKPTQFGYSPQEDLFGLEAELKPRKANSHTREARSWFGPNGQYIRELPCPSCRGRGYTPCTECGIERSRSDCPKCNGKGLLTCHQCSGDCVIWEESIDEQPWETARSISPLRVKEDDEVDKLDIKLDVKKKSKRVYQSPTPEVGLKISRSLKKVKRTAAARKRASKTMKTFFSNPINRQKRSIAMKGVKFYCQNCGREGHKRNYCPELMDSSFDKRFTCGLCGEKGHDRRTCSKLRISHSNGKVIKHRRCKICRQYGHNRKTCPQVVSNTGKDIASRRTNKCRLCQKRGHNVRTCPSRVGEDLYFLLTLVYLQHGLY